jgi:hypothetical protein
MTKTKAIAFIQGTLGKWPDVDVWAGYDGTTLTVCVGGEDLTTVKTDIEKALTVTAGATLATNSSAAKGEYMTTGKDSKASVAKEL